MVACSGNAQGLKQFDRNFCNVFVQKYQIDPEKKNWQKNVYYFDEEGKMHRHANSIHFDAEILPKIVAGYNQYSVLNNNRFWHSKRFELADDDRWIKPRINCQYSQGLYMELYDYRQSKVIMRQKI